MSIHAFPPGVRILLPADALFVIDVLRRFERFRHGYDQKHLDTAAAAIRERLGDDAVDGLMSDALLLDNELRLRTNGAFDCMPEGAPSATQDELHLIRMIACMQAGEYKSAAEHATRLEIVQSRALLMLANKIAARLARPRAAPATRRPGAELGPAPGSAPARRSRPHAGPACCRVGQHPGLILADRRREGREPRSGLFDSNSLDVQRTEKRPGKSQALLRPVLGLVAGQRTAWPWRR